MTAATSLPESATPLAGARIVLGVSGGIAAYKSVEVCRRLVDAGAHVTPVMTEGATHFLGPTTLTALASEPVRTSLWEGADAIPHTRLGQTADLVVVAPCTARVVSAYAHGLSTDLLTNILIATRAPVVVAPAMHTEMWEHPAVAANIELLAARGVHIVPPEVGRLAGGDVGAGRLADPATIVAAATAALGPRDFSGLRVVVTAGGTREPIDAVRVIANRSSGRQGHALAAEAQRRGAAVTLITAAERVAPAGVDVVRVETAEEMRAAVHAVADADVIVMSAALPPGCASRSEDQESRRHSDDRTRTDHRHTCRTWCVATARHNPGRICRRNQRCRGLCTGEAGSQGRRSHRRKRCVCRRCGLWPHHQCGHARCCGRSGARHCADIERRGVCCRLRRGG